VEAARESLVIGSVWGMARERMQDNDEEKLQNTGEDDRIDSMPPRINLLCYLPDYLSLVCLAICPLFCHALCHRLTFADSMI